MLISDRDPWLELAACRNVDTALFFPVRGEDNESAKRVCAECPCRSECLEFALDHVIQDGVWGGTSERQRRILRRARRRSVGLPLVVIHGTQSGYRAELAAGTATCVECRRANNEINRKLA